jgi:hypothetical protein
LRETLHPNSDSLTTIYSVVGIFFVIVVCVILFVSRRYRENERQQRQALLLKRSRQDDLIENPLLNGRSRERNQNDFKKKIFNPGHASEQSNSFNESSDAIKESAGFVDTKIKLTTTSDGGDSGKADLAPHSTVRSIFGKNNLDSVTSKSIQNLGDKVTKSIDNNSVRTTHSPTSTIDASEMIDHSIFMPRIQIKQSFVPTAISADETIRRKADIPKSIVNDEQRMINVDLSKLWLRKADDEDVWYVNANDSELSEWELPEGDKEISESELATVKSKMKKHRF